MGAVSVFSLILLVFAIIAGIVLAHVFKEAAARNKNRPGGGDDEGFDTMSDDERARRARRNMVLLLGGPSPCSGYSRASWERSLASRPRR